MSVFVKKYLWMGLLAALLVPTASMSQAPKNDFIVYGGDVVTMDKAGTVAEAVWVRDGKIEAIGSREEVMRNATPETERIDLHGGALLPGFVEPHLHLDFVTLMSFYTDVSPCLPEPYETRKNCPRTLEESLQTLVSQDPGGTGWLVGSGIDPSRTPGPSAALFHEQPAQFIDKYVSKTRPVIILDKSEHLAYANRQAFVAAGICAKVEDCGPSRRHPENGSPTRTALSPACSWKSSLLRISVPSSHSRRGRASSIRPRASPGISRAPA